MVGAGIGHMMNYFFCWVGGAPMGINSGVNNLMSFVDLFHVLIQNRVEERDGMNHN